MTALETQPAVAAGPAALEVRNLVKDYGKFRALHGIDFDVRPGEIFGLLGPNGAGKTTTIEIIIGLRSATSGSVRVFGLDAAQDPRGARGLVGIQLQQSGFYDHLTLEEQLRFLGACYGTRPNTQHLLEAVGLADRARWKIKQLSGGQQQRFALAAALVNEPPLVLLDEPSTGLDPQARQHFWVLIRRLREDGHTVLLSTHYMEEAEALCDRVAIVDSGRIAAVETPNNLIDRLLATGFRRPVQPRDASLEDVFMWVTGHEFKDEATEHASGKAR